MSNSTDNPSPMAPSQTSRPCRLEPTPPRTCPGPPPSTMYCQMSSYCQVVANLLLFFAILLPIYYKCVSENYQEFAIYCKLIANLLPINGKSIAPLLPSYFQVIAKLLPFICQFIVKFIVDSFPNTHNFFYKNQLFYLSLKCS